MYSKWGIYGLGLMAGFVLCAEALAAGPAIDDVWKRYGGARLYYDALMEPRQMDTQGMRRKDPALMRNLPPITEVKAQPTRRRSSSTARTSKASKAAKPVAAQVSAGLPTGQATSAKPSLTKGATPQAAKVPALAAPGSVARPSSARDAGYTGGLAPTQNRDDVFVPPPAGAAPASPTAASSNASTTSAGNGGRVAGSGQTSR